MAVRFVFVPFVDVIGLLSLGQEFRKELVLEENLAKRERTEVHGK
jgi:hypothetical protein